MNYYQDYQYDFGTATVNGQENAGTAGIPGKDDDRKLFVGGLTRQTNDREIKEYFSKFGEVESVTVKVDPYTGQSRGFAFVVFADASTIDELLTSDHYINKRKVDPKKVSKKPQHGKIFVGGITPDISDTDIKNFFSQYGSIVEVQTPFDKEKNQRKGFCFITFESKNVVYELLKTPKQIINGKEVDVKKVRINPDAVGRGGTRNYPAWASYTSYPTYFGHPNDYAARFNSFDGYDYSGGYVYDGVGVQGAYGTTGKPRGGARQFQRPQPY